MPTRPGGPKFSFRGNYSRPLAALVLLAVGLAAMSLAAARWDTWPGDVRLTRLLQGMLNTYTKPVITWTTTLGNTVVLFSISFVAALWLIYQRRPRFAVLLVAVMALEVMAVALIKWVVQRPRPELPPDLQALANPSSYSFPSGHVAYTAAFFGILAYLLIRHWRRSGWPRWMALAVFLAPPVLMGPARVSWGIHWPSDVLGGYLLAFVGIQLLVLLDRLTGPQNEHDSFTANHPLGQPHHDGSVSHSNS